jgi:hypothetical protein
LVRTSNSVTDKEGMREQRKERPLISFLCRTFSQYILQERLSDFLFETENNNLHINKKKKNKEIRRSSISQRVFLSFDAWTT